MEIKKCNAIILLRNVTEKLLEGVDLIAFPQAAVDFKFEGLLRHPELAVFSEKKKTFFP